MKKLLLFFTGICLAFCFNASAQCPGCNIDTTQTTVGIYPDTLLPAVLNSPYDEDITFVMFTDTFGLTVNSFQIVSVTGLPAGISWECNNVGNGCVYDPQVNNKGCVKICGTPTQPGIFNMVVTVMADIQLLGNQTVTFIRPFIVLPPNGGNAGFTFSPSYGCDSALVQFNSILSAYGYYWDFGNGQLDSTHAPSSSYNAPGDYVVTMDAIISYTLDSIVVSSVCDNYNELGFLDPDPDLYFILRDTSGAAVYTTAGSSINNASFPYTWIVSGVSLTDQVYSLQMFDEDNILLQPDDDCGTVYWNGTSTTGTVTGTISGVSGQLSITYYSSPFIFSVTDTVHVYSSPVVSVSSLQNDSLCAGDSALLSVNAGPNDLIQWYVDTILLIGLNAPDIWVSTTGNYSAVVSDVNGCQGTSSVYTFTSVPNPPKPTYSVAGSVLTCYLTGYNLQWYFNGNIIPGATDTTLTATATGLYHVIATNYFGCTTTSDTIFINLSAIEEQSASGFDFNVLPNNGNGMFQVEINSQVQSDFSLTILDANGRLIDQQRFDQLRKQNISVDVTDQPNGIYFIQIMDKRAVKTGRYIKLH